MRAIQKLLVSTLSMISVVTFTGCAVVGQGVDAPIDVPADYAAREQQHMEDSDRCGPEFLQERLSAGMLNIIGPIADGPFRPVCKRHDACYRLKEMTQAWCDDRMRDEMISICNTGEATPAYSVPVIGPSLCRFHAGLYYQAINSPAGAVAYKGQAGGKIVDIRSRRVEDWLSNDEFEVCVDVTNNTKSMQEYDIELHTADGKLVDREPDTYERNVRAEETEEFCVGTNYSAEWSISNLTEIVYISIRADDPSNFDTTDDMVIVDTAEVPVPGR